MSKIVGRMMLESGLESFGCVALGYADELVVGSQNIGGGFIEMI